MTEPFANRDNLPLERELAGLRRWAAFPETPDLTPAVAARVRAQRRPRSSWWTGDRRPLLAAAAVLLLALAVTLTLSERAREAVADAFGIPGIRIEFIDESTTAPSNSLPVDLGLGTAETLGAVAEAAEFPVATLDAEAYGPPDGVYLRYLPDGTHLVSLVYLPDDRFPETAETGVGLLLMQFEANMEVQYLIKSIGRNGSIRDARIDGRFGYWIEGTTVLTIAGASNEPRSSGNILIWQANGVTYRMESALSMSEAIEIAESVSVEP